MKEFAVIVLGGVKPCGRPPLIEFGFCQESRRVQQGVVTAVVYHKGPR